MLIDAMHTKWQAQWQCDGPGGWLERAPHHFLPPKIFFIVDFTDVNNHISIIALIAQLDRATLYESVGWTFKSF